MKCFKMIIFMLRRVKFYVFWNFKIFGSFTRFSVTFYLVSLTFLKFWSLLWSCDLHFLKPFFTGAAVTTSTNVNGAKKFTLAVISAKTYREVFVADVRWVLHWRRTAGPVWASPRTLRVLSACYSARAWTTKRVGNLVSSTFFHGHWNNIQFTLKSETFLI